MNEETQDNDIVIATMDCSKALYVFAQATFTGDEIKIKFTTKYAPTVDYLIRILRKSFGWKEIARDTCIVENTICYYNEHRVCKNDKVTDGINCNEITRKSCKYYKRKFDNKFVAQYVVMQKLGVLR